MTGFAHCSVRSGGLKYMASDMSSAVLPAAPLLEQVLSEYRDQYNVSLLEITNAEPSLLVFLRHFGCPFCRETLSDIHDSLPQLEKLGVKPILVHMGDEEDTFALFAKYGLSPLSRIACPTRMLYKAFGLSRGKTGEFLCADTVKRCGEALLGGHSIGKVQGDILQMPGAFLVHKGRVLNSFRHKHPGDRPDYLRLCNSEQQISTAMFGSSMSATVSR